MKGFGLSLFISQTHAINAYSKNYFRRRSHLRSKFVDEYGDSISALQIEPCDGIGGDENDLSGHFSFHEYQGCYLTEKKTKIFSIFDSNGKIVNQ